MVHSLLPVDLMANCSIPLQRGGHCRASLSLGPLAFPTLCLLVELLPPKDQDAQVPEDVSEGSSAYLVR